LIYEPPDGRMTLLLGSALASLERGDRLDPDELHAWLNRPPPKRKPCGWNCTVCDCLLEDS
jgi:hypothetical protein